jgi:protein-S-isoprenylcysteine O-methyltransferase Ste14
VLAYGVLSYLVFLAAAGCFVAFLVGLLPGRSVDVGPLAPPGVALAVDLSLLLALVLVQWVRTRGHAAASSARGRVPPTRRSSQLLVSAAALGILIWCWRPLPEPVWQAESRWLVAALAGLRAFGWLLAAWATLWIDHLDLFGLRRVLRFWACRPYRPVPFRVEGGYRFVRHPILLGALVGLWSTPRMSLGHLLISAVLTAWIAVGAALEERRLAGELGEPYRRYLARVPAFLPRWRPRRRGAIRRR